MSYYVSLESWVYLNGWRMWISTLWLFNIAMENDPLKKCFLMIYLLNNGDSPVRYVKSPEGNNAHTDKHISLDTLSDKPKTNPTNPRHRT